MSVRRKVGVGFGFSIDIKDDEDEKTFEKIVNLFSTYTGHKVDDLDFDNDYCSSIYEYVDMISETISEHGISLSEEGDIMDGGKKLMVFDENSLISSSGRDGYMEVFGVFELKENAENVEIWVVHRLAQILDIENCSDVGFYFFSTIS